MNTSRPAPAYRLVRWVPALILAILSAAPARAQREGYSYLSYVGSDVSLVSRGEDDSTARVNVPVMAGDRLFTGSSSRAEAVLASGTVVRIDARSDLRFDRLSRTYESDDDRDLLYLERGAISLETRTTTGRDTAPRVDTDDATILLAERGLFRVDTGRRGTEVYVVTGRAELTARSGRVVLRGGQYAFVSGGDEIEVTDGDVPRDRFTRFVDDRRDRPRGGGVSYVSSDYDYDYAQAGLDDNGSWVYVPSFGRNCWRPRAVADWRPYTNGYWRWTPSGLTWVSYESWGWLPYHYGSWSFDSMFGWCWLPGSVYSPAWVYWSYSPSYVGWCPVGYYGGYYQTYHRSSRIGGGYLAYPHLAGRVDITRIDHRGWNYVPTNRIGTRIDSARDVVRGDRASFRSGEVGVISTAPLRIERGTGSISSTVQEAVRRVPSTLDAGPRGGGGLNDGLTAILRRDANLSGNAQDELRRSFVRAGEDPTYRPASPEVIGTGRRSDLPTTGGLRTPSRGDVAPDGAGLPRRDASPAETWRRGDASTSGRGDSTPIGGEIRRESANPPGDDWRSTGRDGSSGTTGRGSVAPPARDGSSDTGRRGSEADTRRSDDGWRARSAEPRREPARTEERGREESAPSPRPREDSGWRAPTRQAEPARPEPRSEPAPRSYESPRRESAPAPRVDPPTRHESPRSEPAPRSYEAPRRESAPAPAPAPRSEPPSRSADPPPAHTESRRG